MGTAAGFGVMAAAALASAALAGGRGAPISDVRPIELRPGANPVGAFTTDGRDAVIYQAWRENGNAHGYNVYLVTLPDPSGAPVSVVGVEDPERAAPRDLLRDEPFDGERVMGVVRFARARLDGRQQTVLLTADLDAGPDGALADHATATIRVYQLARTDQVGSTHDHFALVWRTQTRARFCNAELALAKTLRLPLETDYQGANMTDGCP
jgi:hypothetical protein